MCAEDQTAFELVLILKAHVLLECISNGDMYPVQGKMIYDDLQIEYLDRNFTSIQG